MHYSFERSKKRHLDLNRRAGGSRQIKVRNSAHLVSDMVNHTVSDGRLLLWEKLTASQKHSQPARGGLKRAWVMHFHGKLLLTVTTSTVGRIHLVLDTSYSLPYSYETTVFQSYCKHLVHTTRWPEPLVLTQDWQAKKETKKRLPPTELNLIYSTVLIESCD